ncbi:MAG: hypothetical protein HY049_02165 [Acidobacteria bacterium]|nr:hypothetical protein [Acidobacteriota bacterium]
MAMPQSEKNFLEKVADLIPGLAGYRAKEARRDTDKRLREHVASRLDDLRARVEEIKLAATGEGDLDMLDDLGRLDSRIQRTADALRFADYGYSGFFDQVKIREEELDRLYAYDEAILGDLDLLERDLGSLKYEAIGTLTLREVEGILASIELKVSNRKYLFDTPTT